MELGRQLGIVGILLVVGCTNSAPPIQPATPAPEVAAARETAVAATGRVPRLATPAPSPASDYLIDAVTGDVRPVRIAGPLGLGARLGDGGGYVRNRHAVWLRQSTGLALADLDANPIEAIPGGIDIQEVDDGAARIVSVSTFPNRRDATASSVILQRTGRDPIELRPFTEYFHLSPSGTHHFSWTQREGSRTVVLVNDETNVEATITYPYRSVGADFRLFCQSEAAKWSPSGRFISYTERPPEGRATIVVYDTVSGAARRFDDPCPSPPTSESRSSCGRPFPFWAPGADRLFIPHLWSPADGLTVAVYEAGADVIATPFPAELSRKLQWAMSSAAIVWEDDMHTALYDVISGGQLGRWTHSRRGGGYESQGSQQSVLVADGVSAYALNTTSATTASGGTSATSCPGAEVFHSSLVGGYACVEGEVDWVAWSGDGTRLAVTFRSSGLSERFEHPTAVRLFNVEDGGLRQVLDKDLGWAHGSPRPFWAGDGRHLVIRFESTQI